MHIQGTLSRGSSDYNATRSLGAVARKAQELLKRQKEIDQDVSRQWGDARAAGISWAGQVDSSVLEGPSEVVPDRACPKGSGC